MDEKEVDKMINNVIASFIIDGIEVSSEFFCKMREKFIYKNNKNNPCKCLVKKGRK